MMIPIIVPDAPVILTNCYIFSDGSRVQFYQSSAGTIYLCFTRNLSEIRWYKIVP